MTPEVFLFKPLFVRRTTHITQSDKFTTGSRSEHLYTFVRDCMDSSKNVDTICDVKLYTRFPIDLEPFRGVIFYQRKNKDSDVAALNIAVQNYKS